MKKILSILTAVVICFQFSTASAQSAVPLTPTLDSIVTSSSLDTVYATKQVGSGFTTVTIQVVATKVSGTVTGTVELQGSLDGVNYTRIATDTLAMTNVSVNTKIWTVTNNPYIYYRTAVFAPSSTYKAYIRNYILLRRQQ